MSNDYARVWDALCATIGAAEGQSAGYFDKQDHLSIDQRLKVAQIGALLSIAQEISALNPANTTSRDKDGTTRNGWGLPIPK